MRIFAAGASGATGTYVEVRILSTKKVSGKTLWYCICGRYGMYSPRESSHIEFLFLFFFPATGNRSVLEYVVDTS